MSDALDRLTNGYYNSQPVSDANPGGFGADGHFINFPLALADIGEVGLVAASGAQLIALAEGTAFCARSVRPGSITGATAADGRFVRTVNGRGRDAAGNVPSALDTFPIAFALTAALSG